MVTYHDYAKDLRTLADLLDAHTSDLPLPKYANQGLTIDIHTAEAIDVVQAAKTLGSKVEIRRGHTTADVEIESVVHRWSYEAPELSDDRAADALLVDGRRYPLSGPVTMLGRSSACDVPLDDVSASRRHAEIRRRAGKTVLVDLDSTNGTLVNGRRVREAPLRAGDRITIGTTTIVFERAS